MPYVTTTQGATTRHSFSRSRVRRWWSAFTGVWTTDPPQITTYTSSYMFDGTSTVRSYRDVRRGKEFAIHDFDLDRTRTFSVAGNQQLVVKWSVRTMYTIEEYTDTFSGDLSWWRYSSAGPLSGAPTFDQESLKQRVLLGAQADARKPSFELGVNLGELRETLEMLRDPFSALRKILRKFSQGKPIRVNDLASKWMETRYGIMPLIYSIRDLVEYARKKDIFLPNTLYSGRSRVVRRESSTQIQGPISFDGWQLVPAEIYNFELVVGAVSYYRYERSPSLGYLLGVDVSSIPSVAWELTKLSWMVDWFFNVSQFLQAYRYAPDVVDLGNCVTTVLKQSNYGTVASASYKGVVINPEVLTYCTSKVLIKRIGGQALPSFPLVDLTWNSVVHTADSLALLWQSIPTLKKH